MKVLSDYECPSCSHRFEAYARTDDKSIRCPMCNTVGANKLPGIPNFRLYGEGFTNRSQKDTGDWS